MTSNPGFPVTGMTPGTLAAGRLLGPDQWVLLAAAGDMPAPDALREAVAEIAASADPAPQPAGLITLRRVTRPAPLPGLAVLHCRRRKATVYCRRRKATVYCRRRKATVYCAADAITGHAAAVLSVVSSHVLAKAAATGQALPVEVTVCGHDDMPGGTHPAAARPSDSGVLLRACASLLSTELAAALGSLLTTQMLCLSGAAWLAQAEPTSKPA